MPDWISIIILGIIEGITEFLPISSTGHLLIAEQWLPRQSDLFNVVIQGGAVLAVIPLFWGRFHQFIHRSHDPKVRSYMAKILVAFFITGVGGFALEHLHKIMPKVVKALHLHGDLADRLKEMEFKLPEELQPVAWALLIGGIAFVVVENWLKGKKLSDEVTWTIAIVVGFGQLVAAVFPGASRSGTTILLSLLLGLNRPLATEFSFLVGIPTMLAASGYKIFKEFHHPVTTAPHEDYQMLILATVVSAAVSFIAVKWLLRYVQTHTFIAFGWYRIVLGIAVLAYAMHWVRF